jgi:hypothetical protein
MILKAAAGLPLLEVLPVFFDGVRHGKGTLQSLDRENLTIQIGDGEEEPGGG